MSEPKCNCGNEGKVFHEVDCPVNFMFGKCDHPMGVIQNPGRKDGECAARCGETFVFDPENGWLPCPPPCDHRDVTVSEDGGRCNQCGNDLVFDDGTGNWQIGPGYPDAGAVAFPAPARSLADAVPEPISIGARQPGNVGYDRPEPPGVDLLGDLRVIAEHGFLTPERAELVVQKRKNGDVVFIIVERETSETVREHRVTLAPGLQMKLMNLLHAPTAGKSENPPTDPAPDYDMSIHSNPDAGAWAKFFVETIEQLAERNIHPEISAEANAAEVRQLVLDEGYMLGWFANAMMAMHDHMESKKQREAEVIQHFRELEPGEVICEGDEYRLNDGSWLPAFAIGSKVPGDIRYRRPVDNSILGMFDGLTDEDFEEHLEIEHKIAAVRQSVEVTLNLLHAMKKGADDADEQIAAIKAEEDWKIPGWGWAIFVVGVIMAVAISLFAIQKGAL